MSPVYKKRARLISQLATEKKYEIEKSVATYDAWRFGRRCKVGERGILG